MNLFYVALSAPERKLILILSWFFFTYLESNHFLVCNISDKKVCKLNCNCAVGREEAGYL